MLYGIFNEEGICRTIVEDADMGPKLPKTATVETWPGRYRLVDDKVVDAFPGIDDATAISMDINQRQEIEAIRAVEVAEKKKALLQGSKLTRLEFMQRFTPEERVALRSLESTDPIVGDLFEMIRLAEFINTKDETTIQGINYLSANGYITTERAGQVLQ